MALKNKYQREKQQYSDDGGLNWYDVSPANYRRGRLLEAASEDCNTIEWREVDGSWFCVPDSYYTRWITDSGQYECVGYNKYSVEKEQSTTDGGLTWTDTGDTRRGTLIQTNSPDCGYNSQYRWVNVSNEYVCDGTTKYNKEKEQVSTDDGVTWTDTGNTRKGDVVIEQYSTDCNYVPLNRWVLVNDDFYCVGNDKYAMEKKQVSMDNGATFEDVVPPTYRQGAIIERNSEDCMIYERYLTTQMLSSGAIGIENNGEEALTNIAYSKNNGAWTSISYGQYVNVVNGDTIRWKANGYQTSNQMGDTAQMYTTAYGDTYYSYFNSTADFNVYGNPKSLLYRDDFTTFNETYTNPNGEVYVKFLGLFKDAIHLIDAKRLAMPSNLAAAYALEYMFEGCTSLVNAPSLPATTLAANCYEAMFKGCTSLTTAPVLSATEMARRCYAEMFYGCTSLVNVSQLPATTVQINSYEFMFYGCTSLVNAPQISGKTMYGSACYGMFEGCTSLVNAPTLNFDYVYDNTCEYMFKNCTSLRTAQFSLSAEMISNSYSGRCYAEMFKGCTSLTAAPTLPATTLVDFCYQDMFNGCTSLVTPPALPATTLTSNCYNGMFYGCTSLTSTPTLSATTLASSCYANMFYGCTSLTTAPTLSATTLAAYCYQGMFLSCTSLVNIPSILPATTLANYCYDGMFWGCTSLTTAPELPATTLVYACYNEMFSRCTSLSYVKAMFTTKPYTGSVGPGTTYGWLSNVSETGTFVKNSAATWTNRGKNAVPNGWTIETASS